MHHDMDLEDSYVLGKNITHDQQAVGLCLPQLGGLQFSNNSSLIWWRLRVDPIHDKAHSTLLELCDAEIFDCVECIVPLHQSQPQDNFNDRLDA